MAVPTFPPYVDGVATAASHHATGFAQEGHDVTVVTLRHPLRRSRPADPSLEVVEFSACGSANLRSSLRGETEEYRQFLLSFKADIVFFHCWQVWTTDLALDLLPRLASKTVMVSHGVSANCRFGWPRSLPTWLGWRPYVWCTMPRAMRLFHGVVFLSERVDRDRFLDRQILRRLGLQTGFVIPNGADLEAHSQTSPGFRSRVGITETLMLLCVGKYDKLKNEYGVAQAILQSGISNAALVLVGPAENPYLEQIRRVWNSAHPAERGLRLVCLPGLGRSEVLQAYKEADIFVSGSKTECLPLVILDAMASSVPFVSTNVGCVSDLPGGIVVRGREEMSLALRRLAADPGLRRTLGNEGRSACECKYSWSRVRGQYAALLDKMVG